MRSLIITALVAIPALSGAASADDTRMNQVSFVRAARCIALADLPVLQSDRLDTSALQVQFAAEKAVKRQAVLDRAKAEIYQVRTEGRSADTPAEVERLRTRRDATCGEFVATPVVAAQN